MKVQKYEISRTIDKLKSIVQKNDQFPALGGVLVKDGYLIASNTEMTMQLKLEASKGSCFIIPMKAFDVIKNLPDGEVIIDADGKNIVTIKTKAIKNKYQSYPPEEFSFDITEDLDAPEVVINGKRMMDAIGHVIYAAADSSSATQMMGVYFEGGENKIKLVALDGHVVAVDSIPTDGTADMKLIVPKTVAKKLVSMGIIDDVAVTYTKNRAVVMEGKVTKIGKTKILKARAGEITLPKIAGFAFGSGGADGSTVLVPGETLKNEFLRKAIDGHTLKINENKCEYYCTLNTNEANGKSISEIGLYDTEGDIIMIANFTAKGKDPEVYMKFEIDDILK